MNRRRIQLRTRPPAVRRAPPGMRARTPPRRRIQPQPRRVGPRPWRRKPSPWAGGRARPRTRWRAGRTPGSPTGRAAWARRSGLRRYSPAARRALGRSGVLRGFWVERFADAPIGLVRFVNRFYRVAGVDQLVQAFYGSPYQRRVARLAVRLIRRLAGRSRDDMPALGIAPTVGVTAGGAPVYTLMVVGARRHYLLLPWPRLQGRGLLRLLRQSAALYGDPARIRWVFDGQ
ncbi:MAG: hypothetical protein KJZ93_15570, partial [Caldilineaceae bacterium]|nr:hypothetical protein [Caldilineaceae bacterium]